MTTRRLRRIGWLLVPALLAGACGGTDLSDDAAEAASRSKTAATVADDLETAKPAASSPAAPAAAPTTTVAAGSASDKAAPEQQQQKALRAGSVDDNAGFADYLDYRSKILQLGITARDLDPSERIVVRVAGTNGLPLAGTAVRVTGVQGDAVATLRTTADGSIRFHPAAYGRQSGGRYRFTVGGAGVDANPGESVQLSAAAPGGPATPQVQVEVLFLLDATGSMGDEIGRLKSSVISVVDRLQQLPGQPKVRLAMTTYRDEGDEYVTRSTDFTTDVKAFSAELAKVEAAGGGDTPEALDEGLAEALEGPSWGDPATTLQLVFLVADAPPQISRKVRTPYTASMINAAERGMKIFPIASSGSDDQAEFVFRQLAQYTGARFVFLSYGADGQGGAAVGGQSDISGLDYEELPLDGLVVRLISEEVASLTGGQQGQPTQQVTTKPSSEVTFTVNGQKDGG